jgi:hypothetical protein
MVRCQEAPNFMRCASRDSTTRRDRPRRARDSVEKPGKTYVVPVREPGRAPP